MEVLVFKTNIQNQRMKECLLPLFNEHPVINDWSVDTEDCDKVLRIESKGNLPAIEIIQMVNAIGIACEILSD